TRGSPRRSSASADTAHQTARERDRGGGWPHNGATGITMRPSNLIYSVDEKPPALVCLVNAAQQLTIITPFLIYPILLMRAVGADDQTAENFRALSFPPVGVGTLLQAWPGRWTGSGFLISSSPAAAFVPIDIVA